ncbi:MAG: LCP family protein [Candidatus Limnocylindrales bacterium]
MTRTSRRATSASSQSASVAALLSFLWPGLGQLYVGRPRAAIIYAAPILLVALIVLAQAVGGIDILFVRLLSPTTAGFVAIVLVLTAVWRLLAISDAFLSARGFANSPGSYARRHGSTWHQAGAKRTLAILAVLVLLSHGLLIGAALGLGQAGSRIFVGSHPPVGSALSSGSAPLPQETPYVTPETGGWINVLLVGADSGTGYDHSLTDSMIVASFNQATGKAVMFSFPRDIARFPLYFGGTYDSKLNSLMTDVVAKPGEYPDGALGTLSRELGFLLGVPIHYYAFIDLAGFSKLIDEVGGIEIDNPRAIDDAGYQFDDGVVGFRLSAGPHHLDGRIGLAYVRSRKGVGDSDFSRARRQQQVLVALRDKLTDPAMLSRVPALLDLAPRIIQTNYPVDDAPNLLALAKKVQGAAMEHIVLGPPYAERPTEPTSTYMLVLQMSVLRRTSIRIFGSDSRYANEASPAP